MDEEKKKQIAVFRFGVIADFVTGATLSRGEKERLLKDKCARKWNIPYSNRTSIGRSTLRDWIANYQDGGNRLEALYPNDRTDRGKSRSIDEQTSDNLICLRGQMPKATIGALIETMTQRKLICPGTRLNTSNVWRFLHHRNLMPEPQAVGTDRRKFEAEMPNDIWQSDVMHGPFVFVNSRRRKAYLIAFIDDHSRLVPYGGFYLSENLAAFLDAFEKALLKRGLPRKLYVDNGSAFRSKQLEHICASLGIALIHSKPYQPQGRGKIERMFRTIRTQFLPTVEENTSLADLNNAFSSWLTQYHERRHSGTAQSPLHRYADNIQCLRPAPDNLKDHFRMIVRRTVAKDRSVTIDGRLFEAPVALISKRIDLLFHKDDPAKVEARLAGKSYGMLQPVDLAVNCRVKRDRNRNTQIDIHDSPKPSSGRIW
ncbi:MAG: DDE-type integrase/transposase/recombinase [Desulfosarcina sp.]|jgi:transposase InsO family protein